jgi:hypothetical protein
MHVRFHVLEVGATSTATLFAIRHNAGHLICDGNGAVILAASLTDADVQRRKLPSSAVSRVVALVPEPDVRDGGVFPDALVPPLTSLLSAAVAALGGAPPFDLDVLASNIEDRINARLEQREVERQARMSERLEEVRRNLIEHMTEMGVATVAPPSQEAMSEIADTLATRLQVESQSGPVYAEPVADPLATQIEPNVLVEPERQLAPATEGPLAEGTLTVEAPQMELRERPDPKPRKRR